MWLGLVGDFNWRRTGGLEGGWNGRALSAGDWLGLLAGGGGMFLLLATLGGVAAAEVGRAFVEGLGALWEGDGRVARERTVGEGEGFPDGM